MYKKIVLALSVFMLLSGISFGGNYSFTTPAPETSNYLQGQVIYVPQGAVASVVMSTPISSETAYLGAEVLGTFVSPFSYNGKVIAPKGCKKSGTCKS